MIIAQEKKKKNIIEYIIYMYQIEDIIRASGFDMSEIRKKVIDKFDVDSEIKEEMIVWYQDLIQKMQNQNILKSGHLDFLNDLTEELQKLHTNLIHDPQHLDYIKQYQLAKPNIIAYKERANRMEMNDVECCLQGVYSLLLLRLKQDNITHQTELALETFSKLLALLAGAYHKSYIDS
jgi:hypothetical protein